MSAKWRNQPDLFSVPRARWDNPQTSKAAAASIPLKSVTQTQERVLALLRMYGPLSDEELEGIFEDCWPNSASPQGVRSRRGELRRKGLIVDSGRRGVTKYGRVCTIWQVAS